MVRRLSVSTRGERCRLLGAADVKAHWRDIPRQPGQEVVVRKRLLSGNLN